MISTCAEPWGGSEELWSQSAAVLLQQGFQMSAFKTVLDRSQAQIQRLTSLSCAVRNLPWLPLPNVVTKRVHQMLLAIHLLAHRPELVVISQGDNQDGLHFGYVCHKLKIPYTLISQKASDHLWPRDNTRDYGRKIFVNAMRCFFVSEHNVHLTQQQYDLTFTNAEVVRNPYVAGTTTPLPWPGGEDECLRLACVARLYLLDKGQDILLRVLARDKWRRRCLHVSFVGRGANGEGLKALGERLGVRNVSFEGQIADVSNIWRTHHALILPSRAEGLPLSMVEAMISGRTAIVTNVGGNAEIIDDRVTGFLADPTEDSLDAALEGAWTRRSELDAMGQAAAARIRELVPLNPAINFADRLLEIITAAKAAQPARVAAVNDPLHEPESVR